MSRCLASAVVVPGQMKRCALAAGHTSEHLWLEAVRTDGGRTLALWGKDKAVRMYELTEEEQP